MADEKVTYPNKSTMAWLQLLTGAPGKVKIARGDFEYHINIDEDGLATLDGKVPLPLTPENMYRAVRLVACPACLVQPNAACQEAENNVPGREVNYRECPDHPERAVLALQMIMENKISVAAGCCTWHDTGGPKHQPCVPYHAFMGPADTSQDDEKRFSVADARAIYVAGLKAGHESAPLFCGHCEQEIMPHTVHTRFKSASGKGPGVCVQSSTMKPDQAERLLNTLRVHFSQPVLPIRRYCSSLMEWSRLVEKRGIMNRDEVGNAVLAITKSNLLARLLYSLNDGLRTIECPEHKGTWSGIEDPANPCRHGCELTGWLRQDIISAKDLALEEPMSDEKKAWQERAHEAVALLPHVKKERSRQV